MIPLLLAAVAAVPFHVADLSRNETRSFRLPGAGQVSVTLLAVNEIEDPMQGAIRRAEVTLRVAGREITIGCGNYELPAAVGNVQVDCPVTGGYRSNSTIDHWALEKDARIRIWPPGAWIDPASFGFPLRQRWLATHTQMANEPTYVDRGERWSRSKIYYHAGLDSGGAEGMTEVIAATDGLVVSLGDAILKEHDPKQGADSPVARRYDVIYLLDDRGWYYRYSHLHSFDPSVKLGERVRIGRKLGLLGKEGGSGGWSHLHFEAVARQPSGRWGTQEAYAFLWDARVRQARPPVIAVARPHRVAFVHEKVELDASHSRALGGASIRSYSRGQGREGVRAEARYARPGTYSEVLRVTDSRGNTAYDFATVNVVDPADRNLEPPAIHASFYPTMGVKPGAEVTFQVRTFGTTHGEETWDFGDGTPPATTRSDGNVKMLAKDGYARIRHAYAKPGDYIVRVSRTSELGLSATTHLWVKVAD